MVPARCAPVRQQHHSPPGPRHGTTPLWPSASTSIIDASAAVNGGGPSLRCSLCSGGAGRVGYHRSGQYFAAFAVSRASLPRFSFAARAEACCCPLRAAWSWTRARCRDPPSCCGTHAVHGCPLGASVLGLLLQCECPFAARRRLFLQDEKAEARHHSLQSRRM